MFIVIAIETFWGGTAGEGAQKRAQNGRSFCVSYSRLWNAYQQRYSDTTIPRYRVEKSFHSSCVD